MNCTAFDATITTIKSKYVGTKVRLWLMNIILLAYFGELSDPFE